MNVDEKQSNKIKKTLTHMYRYTYIHVQTHSLFLYTQFEDTLIQDMHAYTHLCIDECVHIYVYLFVSYVCICIHMYVRVYMLFTYLYAYMLCVCVRV